MTGLNKNRLLLALMLSSGIAGLAYRRRSLTRGGAAGAIVTGTTIFGLGGWPWGLAMIYFFVSSTLLSHFRERDKKRVADDKFSKGSQRDIAQTAANGGLASLLALLYGLTRSETTRKTLRAAFTGALATATADTWATELGTLSSHQPRLITTGKPVPPGTSGGITLPGTTASALGALTLGCAFWATQGLRKKQASLLLIALLSGTAGSFFDSLLGATLQAMYYCPACEKETEQQVHNCGTPTKTLRGIPWFNNDVVNFLATAFGSAVAVLLNR